MRDKGEPGTPTATIECIEGDVPCTVVWQNEEGISPINRADVFDSRSATIHVDDDLTYTYTPGELNRFPHLQQAIDAIRAQLDQAIADRTVTKNPYTQHFPRTAALYATIENLGATTDLAALETLATITQEEEQRIKSLAIEVEALKSNSPQAQLQVARTRHEHLTIIHSALNALGTIDLVAFQQKQDEFRVANDRYEHASSAVFAGSTIPGVLQADWRTFIEAGEQYLREHSPKRVSVTRPASTSVCR